jgi:uncharacterized protein YggE
MRVMLVLLLVLAAPWASAESVSRYVTVVAEGFVEASPDELWLTVSARQVGQDLETLQALVDKAAAQVAAAAAANGVEPEDVDSSRLSAGPEYEWRKNERVLVGQAVQRDITLRVRNLDTYGKLMQQLSRLSLYRIEQPRLAHSNLDGLRIEALRAALALARAKAEAIAAGVKARLGEVLYVRENGAFEPPVPAGRVMMAEMASADAPEPVFNFAKQRISASVEVSYTLKDKD